MAKRAGMRIREPSVFDKSRAAVEKRLPQLGSGPARILATDDLGVYKGRGVEAGWRLPVEIDGSTHYLDVLLSRGFPWHRARIAVFPSRHLIWPHVESNGMLCLSPEGEVFGPDDPVGDIEFLLKLAVSLISQASKGEIDDDFRNEILSYWGHAHNSIGNHVISLIEPRPPSRYISVCHHKRKFVIADSDSELRQWLSNLIGEDTRDHNIAKAILVWLQSAPLPSEYPKTYKDLFALVRKSGNKSVKILNNFFDEDIEDFIVIFGMDIGGTCLVGTALKIPESSVEEISDMQMNGFRKNKIPRQILRKRLRGKSDLKLAGVQRADSSWIHGRDKDSRAKCLGQKKVAIIGCGSVGGAVSVHIAQAGVGDLTLIDPEYLDWPNVGRHVLGASSIDKPKVVELAKKLHSDLPHVRVHPYMMDVQRLLRQKSEILDEVDLVLSTSANWAADHRVDAWQQNAAHPVPIVYGWIEAHACAGHAVLIGGPPGSIKSGIEASIGHSLFEITAWDNGDPLEREPGCGGQFQPYGPVELAAANSVIASLALDALLERSATLTHRVWVAQERLMREAGGRWSDVWKEDPNFRREGGFVLEREWPRAEDQAVKAAA